MDVQSTTALVATPTVSTSVSTLTSIIKATATSTVPSTSTVSTTTTISAFATDIQKVTATEATPTTTSSTFTSINRVEETKTILTTVVTTIPSTTTYDVTSIQTISTSQTIYATSTTFAPDLGLAPVQIIRGYIKVSSRIFDRTTFQTRAGQVDGLYLQSTGLQTSIQFTTVDTKSQASYFQYNSSSQAILDLNGNVLVVIYPNDAFTPLALYPFDQVTQQNRLNCAVPIDGSAVSCIGGDNNHLSFYYCSSFDTNDGIKRMSFGPATSQGTDDTCETLSLSFRGSTS